jgi:hypothetical protein
MPCTIPVCVCVCARARARVCLCVYAVHDTRLLGGYAFPPLSGRLIPKVQPSRLIYLFPTLKKAVSEFRRHGILAVKVPVPLLLH